MSDDSKTRALAEQLRRDRHYRTPRGRAWCRFGRLGWLRSVVFHTRLMGVYALARRTIRRQAYDLTAYMDSSFRIRRIAELAGGDVEVTGLDHVAGVSGPVVVIGNHMSSLETVLLPGLLIPFKDVAFVVKESLLTYPIFGPIMRAVKNIPVGRQNPRDDLKQVLVRGEEFLKGGVSVVIFPQATRSAVFNPAEFNSLGVKLAARAGVPVIPLAMRTDFMGNGRVFKDLGLVDPERPIRFAFGPPLQPAGNGREAHEAVVSHIVGHLTQWGGQIRKETP
jgi:1-acyl-sn-glycerol-3-phosphate acyltransferase